MFLSLDIRDYNNVRIAMKTASGDMHVMHVPPMLSPCLFYRQEDNITNSTANDSILRDVQYPSPENQSTNSAFLHTRTRSQ